ncbi:MAG: protein kinase [Bacteroidales bacterium]|nr:protein kinase [Bacteroidales bacterium]
MIGKTINGFTLQRKLGEGGMAEVWYAENEIGKPAAVKILSSSLSNNEQIVERFHNEALVMVKLDHPNIRQVYGYGYIDNRHCIVMEYLEGDDLEALLKKGRRFTDEELSKWWNQIISALNYTHSKGIVHRDIKPSNIFLDNWGNVKLLDFGIAKLKESMSMTRTGTMMGTLMYMSPEQVRDTKNIDYRTDIYSLAVTFAQLVSGTAPYDATSSDDYTIRKGIVELPFDLSAVPAAWQGFLAPYLDKDPEKRPALRPFEAVPLSAKPETPSSGGFEIRPTGKEDLQSSSKAEKPTVVAETTSAKPTPNKPKPVTPKPRSEPAPVSPEPTDEPKSKTGLWIALGVVAAAAVLLLLLLKPKKEEPVVVATDPDTEAYQACYNVNDYRTYIAEYGRNAHHYSEAKQFIDNYVADSTAKAQQAFAEAQANQQAEAEKEKEDAAYKKCTTIAACDSYLKTYPQGRYVVEVEAKKAELEKEPKSGSYSGHEYVDLGLPSGTLWATCNVGASKPEDYGNYYAWGETKTKSVYDWETYKYANGDDYNKLTKYCCNSENGDNGFTDNLTTLQAGDDPATSNWGSGWHTPSKSEWDELLANTTNTWTTQNGVKGGLFTSKNNGQTFFLPAAGYRGGSELYDAGSESYYWSRSNYTHYSGNAWGLRSNSGGCGMFRYGYGRDSGFTVRPVRQK